MSKFSGILAQARHRQSDDDNITVTEEVPSQANVTVQDADILTEPTQFVEKENLPPVSEKQHTSKTKSSRTLKTTPIREVQKLSVQTITPAGVEPVVRRGRPNGKRTDPNYTQITAYITKQTHKAIKVALIEQGNGQEISEVIEECLREWLKQNN